MMVTMAAASEVGLGEMDCRPLLVVLAAASDGGPGRVTRAGPSEAGSCE